MPGVYKVTSEPESCVDFGLMCTQLVLVPCWAILPHIRTVPRVKGQCTGRCSTGPSPESVGSSWLAEVSGTQALQVPVLLAKWNPKKCECQLALMFRGIKQEAWLVSRAMCGHVNWDPERRGRFLDSGQYPRSLGPQSLPFFWFLCLGGSIVPPSPPHLEITGDLE